MKAILGILISLVIPPAMAADFFLSPALSYRSSSSTTGSTTTESSQTYMDLRLGAKVAKNLVLGGLYSTINTSSGSTTVSQTGLGVSVGYLSDQVLLLASFLIQATEDLGSSQDKGTGFQLDLAYHFKASSILVGPMISYKSHNYTENDAGGTTTAKDETEVLIEPYVSLMFHF